tara:strand:+ start:31 stop:1941 length:1911 start_codon:yes stop_codon:yes gene_type:complete
MATDNEYLQQQLINQDPYSLLDPESVYRNREALGATTPYLDDTLGNFPSSAGQLGADVAGLVTNPVQTIDAIGNLGLGLIALAIPDAYQEESLDKPQEAAVAVGQYAVDRLGSIEAVKETMRTDPVGFIADISAILLGGGYLATRGGLKAGQVATQAGLATDPLIVAGRGVGELAGAVSRRDFMKGAGATGEMQQQKLDLPIDSAPTTAAKDIVQAVDDSMTPTERMNAMLKEKMGDAEPDAPRAEPTKAEQRIAELDTQLYDVNNVLDREGGNMSNVNRAKLKEQKQKLTDERKKTFENTEVETPPTTITRRDALKGMGATGIAGLMGTGADIADVATTTTKTAKAAKAAKATINPAPFLERLKPMYDAIRKDKELQDETVFGNMPDEYFPDKDFDFISTNRVSDNEFDVAIKPYGIDEDAAFKAQNKIQLDFFEENGFTKDDLLNIEEDGAAYLLHDRGIDVTDNLASKADPGTLKTHNITEAPPFTEIQQTKLSKILKEFREYRHSVDPEKLYKGSKNYDKNFERYRQELSEASGIPIEKFGKKGEMYNIDALPNEINSYARATENGTRSWNEPKDTNRLPYHRAYDTGYTVYTYKVDGVPVVDYGYSGTGGSYRLKTMPREEALLRVGKTDK